MTLDDEVRAANDAFYRAFRERDLAAMDALWATQAPVACLHPGMDALIGREQVMGSWRGILAHPDAPKLECSSVHVFVLGDAAYVTCHEGTPGSRATLVATNVFMREAGGFRMVCHQAGPLSAPQQPRRKEPRVLN